MADNTIELEIKGNSSNAEAAAKKLLKAQDEIIKSLQKEVAESKKAGDQAVAYYRKASGEAEKMNQKTIGGLERQLAQQQRVNAETKRSGAMWDGVKNSAQGVLGALGVGAGIGGAIATIVGEVKKWDEHMTGIAAKSRQAGQDVVAFALLQEPGQMRARVQAAAKMGGKYGRTMGESWNTVQAMQSLEGSFEGGMKTAEAIFQASLAGMDASSVEDAVVLGRGKGLSADRSIYLPYRAGEISAKSPADMIRAAPALAFWQDPDLAYAAAVEMLKSVRPQQLETYLKSGGVGLSMENEQAGKMYKRLGLSGKSQIEKLRGLRAAGLDTAEELQKAGIPDQEKSLAVAAMVSALPEMEKNAQSLRAGYKPGYAYAGYKTVAATMPEVASRQTSEQMAREFELRQVFGPDAQKAASRELAKQKRGQEFQQRGLIVDESGKVGEVRGLVQLLADIFGGNRAREEAWQKVMVKEIRELKAPGVVVRPNRNPAGSF